MTDHDIENATVIEAFLQITNDWELDGDFSLDILDPLGQFLKKYNCWRPIAILCEGLRNRINEFTCYTVFKAAVYLDRESLIDSVCYKMEEIAAEQDDDDGLGSTRYGFADMAQEITPQDMLQFLPKYQWALVRTLAENECTSGCCTGDGDERGRPWVAFTHNLHEHKRLLQRQPRKKRKLQ